MAALNTLNPRTLSAVALVIGILKSAWVEIISAFLQGRLVVPTKYIYEPNLSFKNDVQMLMVKQGYFMKHI